MSGQRPFGHGSGAGTGLPHDSLVGIKADGDTDYISKDAVRVLNLIAVDPSLTRIEKTNLKLVLLEQKYISVLMRQPSGLQISVRTERNPD